ncbi:MAG: DUF4254 domain-containing protein [Flavobacteriaceae bacterium]|nr:DUF4254 domain-containing protein [Flavobacteriaceae bacterium]
MNSNKISKKAFYIFKNVIDQYHILNTVDQTFKNPFSAKTFDHLLYRKNWIDTVQWHYEDLIRDPNIEPKKGMELKRKIDASNQDRTDMVEFIDSYFLNKYKDVKVLENAEVNSESPAWAIDRLSILALKIYHMEEETSRNDASKRHKTDCKFKLDVLLEQKTDLSNAIDSLLDQISKGQKYMKVYKQMKMYNDSELNPVLYKGSK